MLLWPIFSSQFSSIFLFSSQSPSLLKKSFLLCPEFFVYRDAQNKVFQCLHGAISDGTPYKIRSQEPLSRYVLFSIRAQNHRIVQCALRSAQQPLITRTAKQSRIQLGSPTLANCQQQFAAISFIRCSFATLNRPTCNAHNSKHLSRSRECYRIGRDVFSFLFHSRPPYSARGNRGATL